MRSIQVATVRKYVCKRKTVSGVNDIGASVDIDDDSTGDLGTARFKELNTSLGGDSSDTWSKPSILVLKMSQVEAGCSKSANKVSSEDSWAWTGMNCISSMLTPGSRMGVLAVGSAGVLLHDEGAIKSDCLHSKFNRSQLLQTGFFSSQRLCRALQVWLAGVSHCQ